MLLWDASDEEKVDRATSSSAAQLAKKTGRNVLQVAGPGFWSTAHKPATATQATIAKAAVAGTCHVCTGITATIATDSTAQTPLFVTLYDGTSAGTVLWSGSVSAAANSVGGFALTGLSIIGTENTAMTLEFSAAGVTASQQAVTLTGYSTT